MMIEDIVYCIILGIMLLAGIALHMMLLKSKKQSWGTKMETEQKTKKKEKLDLGEAEIRYRFISVTRTVEFITTICHLKIGKKESVGFAFCSERDQFCKKVGRDIALGRAKHAIIQSSHLKGKEYKGYYVDKNFGVPFLALYGSETPLMIAIKKFQWGISEMAEEDILKFINLSMEE